MDIELPKKGKQLRTIQIPGHIDELWSSFYIFEEVWNEKIEDLEDQITGIEYIKIYSALIE